MPIKMAPQLMNRHISIINASLQPPHGESGNQSFEPQSPQVIDTAHFIAQFDQLFDCFSGRGLKCQRNVMGHALSAQSYHMVFLKTIVFIVASTEGLYVYNTSD